LAGEWCTPLKSSDPRFCALSGVRNPASATLRLPPSTQPAEIFEDLGERNGIIMVTIVLDTLAAATTLLSSSRA